MCVGRAKKLRWVNTCNLIASEWITGSGGSEAESGPKSGLLIGVMKIELEQEEILQLTSAS